MDICGNKAVYLPHEKDKLSPSLPTQGCDECDELLKRLTALETMLSGLLKTTIQTKDSEGNTYIYDALLKRR